MSAAPITRVSGHVAADGSALLLQLEANGSVLEFALNKSDVGGLVNLLLALSSLASGDDDRRGGGQPLVDFVSVGETAAGDAVLGFEIGAVNLAFGLPRRHLQRLARVLLTLSADAQSLS